MKGKRRTALILASILIFHSLFGGIVTTADADTLETVPVLETLEAESVEMESVPEESTDLEYVPEESTEPEETIEFMVPDIVLQEYFPAVTISQPAPLGKPVRGDQTRKIVHSGDDMADNLVLNKTVTDHGNETYTILLESYATGTASVVTKVPIPSDVVLVLDESGSMNDCIECGHEMSEECNTLNGDCLHKVYLSELDTAKKYKTYYSDKTERIVGYCSSCQNWYTGGPFKKCSGHGSLGYWLAFSSEADKTSYGDKVYFTQFYAACNHDTQRMDALKGAVTNFLNKMYTSSLGTDGISGTEDDVDHKVAIVGFDNDTPARIYTPKDKVSVGYVLADSSANATGTLQSILSNKTAVMEALGRVRVRSATATNRGMEAANLILANNPVPAGCERNRVVILFTDGSPGSSYENNKSWANGAIQHAYTLKQSLGATVYTIGLFWGADASDPANLPPYDVNANGVNNLKFFRNGNRFLHLVSSNYPNARSLDDTGAMASLGAGGSYYLSAEDESGLYSIFGKLSNVVTPGSTTVTLDKHTVVKDVVTPFFTMIDPALVTAWTESSTGKNVWEKDVDSVSTVTSGPLTVKVSGNTVSVSNFDFGKQYVAEDETESGETVYRGKRLMIQIDLHPIPGFLGGDSIPTNTEDSAIYPRESDKTPVKRFPVPCVDIPVKQIIPETIEKDIYLSQLSSLPEIVNPGSYILKGSSYETDTVRNAYVDIVYTVKDPMGNSIICTVPAGSEKPIWDIPPGMALDVLLKEDTLYKIGCAVISTNNPQNVAEYQRGAAVNVYYPEITFQDSVINLGQTADYQNNGGSVRWLHNGILADTDLMGPAPELTYFYDPVAAAFQHDTSVKVSITAIKNLDNQVPEDQDITHGVIFYRDECDFTSCDHRDRTKVNPTTNRINFVVHINTFELKIHKTGADLDLDPDSSFLFRISGPNGFSMDAVIHGNGYAVIENLPVAEYTITEITDWSWRYEPEANDQKILATDVKDGIASITFNNVRKHKQWLDGEHFSENRFYHGTQPEGGEVR